MGHPKLQLRIFFKWPDKSTTSYDMLKDSYLHVSRKCKSLAAFHFRYDFARDIFNFSFDQKYKSINEYDKNF